MAILQDHNSLCVYSLLNENMNSTFKNKNVPQNSTKTASLPKGSVNIVNQNTFKSQSVGNVSLRTRFVYSGPSLSIAMSSIMISAFVPKLYSDVYKVPVSKLGFITLVALIFDAISDPLVGYFSDVTRTSYGRRRPYIFLGGLLLVIAAGGLLAPPTSLTRNGLVIWASLFIILLFLANTMIRVPWLALGVELVAGSHQEKTLVFATREIIWISGSIIAAGLPLIVNISDQKKQFRVIAAVISIITLIVTLLCVIYVKEERYQQLKERIHPLFKGCCLIFNNYLNLSRNLLSRRSARSLFFVSTLNQCAVSLNAFFFPYFVEYILGEVEKLEVLLITYILCGVFFVPIWVWLSKKFEKYNLFRASIAIQSFVLLIAYFTIREGDFILYLAIILGAGISFGGVSTLKYSMIGDLADIDEWTSCRILKTRREGEIQGLFDFFGKVLSAVVIGPSSFFLDHAGYIPKTTQSNHTKSIIRLFYALIPGILGTLSVFILHFYDITKERYATMKMDYINKIKNDPK